MGFINKQTDTSVIRAKLTDKGRELLSQGKLTYKYWSCGDSEIDYNFILNTGETPSQYMILSPKDNDSAIKTPIPAYVGGDVYNALNEVVSIKKEIAKIQPKRGVFSNDNAILDGAGKPLYKAVATVPANGLTGTKTIGLSNVTGMKKGDYLVIGIKTPLQTGGNVTLINTKLSQYLTYKIVSISGNNVTLDRSVPSFTSGTGICPVYCIEGNDPINTFYSSYAPEYWDFNNLSYQTNNGIVSDEVGVWNFNIVYTENFAGLKNDSFKDINEYGGRFYSGIKEYLNYTSNSPQQKALGIVHYTNNMVTNVYGESFAQGSFSMTLPTIMWDKNHADSGAGESMGLTLISVRPTDVSNAPYDNLVDGLGNVVGKVFNTLQIAVIDDEELLAAMSLRSNRNWTLPELNGLYFPATSEETGLMRDNEETYVTYFFHNTLTEGFKTALPCQRYVKISRGGLSQNNIRVNFPKNRLPFLKPELDANGGFTANKVLLLVQKVTKGERPASNNWKVMDVTSEMGLTGNINPVTLELKTVEIDKAKYDAAVLFDLESYMVDLTVNTNPDGLLFGEERILFGHVSVSAQATVYKSSFIFPLLFNQFKESNNPTYLNKLKPIYVSEIGVFNENKEMVLSGKLSNPLIKENGDTILLQLEIDF